MIVKKAVKCVRPECNSRHHQMVNTDLPPVVENCPKCGGPCVMYLGAEGNRIFTAEERLELVDLVNLALAGSATHNRLLRTRLVNNGYEILGFHGCSYASACSIIRAGIDLTKIKTIARGRGFYVGSHYGGLASDWSRIAAGRSGGTPIILTVYARNFETWEYGTDYDWGKMDEEDSEDLGLEIAVFETKIGLLHILPAIMGDEATISWDDCPRDSLGYKERMEFEEMRPQLESAARTHNLTYGALVKKIVDEKLTKSEKATLEKLGLA